MSKSIPSHSHSTTEAAELLGVSIPTVQRWVDAGRLKAWKTPGGHRRIDAQSVQEWREEMGLGTPPKSVPAAAVHELSVVIVDDNPDDIDLLRAIVETALPAALIRTYENGIQALVAIGHHAPDIFITDLTMPHLDGVEVLRQLGSQCEVRPALVIAVSSSYDGAGQPTRDIPEGVHFFPKPVNHRSMATLLKAVFPADAG